MTNRILLVGCGAEIGSMLVGLVVPETDGREVAAINHETAFWVVDDNLRAFRNKGVFLFLSVVDFANTVTERFRGLA